MATYLKANYSTRGDGYWDTNTEIPVYNLISVKVHESYGNSVPTATVVVAGKPTMLEGNEIRLYKSKVHSPPSDGEIYFRGFVTSVKNDGFKYTIECVNFLQFYVNRACLNPLDTFEGTYTYTDIIKYIVCEAYDVPRQYALQVSANYVDISSDLLSQTVINYDCTNHTIFERLMNICEILDACMYYDAGESLIKIFKRGTKSVNFYELIKPPKYPVTPSIHADTLTYVEFNPHDLPIDYTINGSGFDSGATVKVYYNGIKMSSGTFIQRTSTSVTGSYHLSTGTYHLCVENSNGSKSNFLTLVVGDNITKILSTPQWSTDTNNIITEATTLGGTYTKKKSFAGARMGGNDTLFWQFIFDESLTGYKVDGLYYTYLGSDYLLSPSLYTLFGNDDTYKDLYLLNWDNNGGHEIIPLMTAMTLKYSADISYSNYTSVASEDILERYGKRDKVITQQNFGDYESVVSYTDNVKNYWNQSNTSVSFKVSTDDYLIGLSASVFDGSSNRRITYVSSPDADDEWKGIVTEQSITYPDCMSTITLADTPIKNQSASSILNRNNINQTNAMNNFDLAKSLKVDGTKVVTNNLDFNGNQAQNFVVHNVTTL